MHQTEDQWISVCNKIVRTLDVLQWPDTLTTSPLDEPSDEPHDEPSDEPKVEPSEKPKVEPSEEPRVEPSEKPNKVEFSEELEALEDGWVCPIEYY